MDDKEKHGTLSYLRQSYPMEARMSDEEWTKRCRVYSPELTWLSPSERRPLCDDVLAYHPEFFPTLAQFRARVIVAKERAERAQVEKARTGALPPPPKTKTAGAADLRRACDEALRVNREQKWTATDEIDIEQLLGDLATLYGCKPEGTKEHSAGLVRIWKNKAHPAAVIKSIARAPRHFKKFPTPGMFQDLRESGSKGDTGMRLWPDEWRVAG